MHVRWAVADTDGMVLEEGLGGLVEVERAYLAGRLEDWHQPHVVAAQVGDRLDDQWHLVQCEELIEQEHALDLECRELRDALNLFGARIFDHIVVGKTTTSMAPRGLI